MPDVTSSIPRIVIGLLFGALVAMPCYAQAKKANPAFQHGLWACSMPAPASRLDQDFTDARGMIEFTYTVLDQLAHRSGSTEGFCKRVNGDNLKIIGFDSFWKVALVTDGEKQDYVGMLSYTSYMSFHVVRSTN